MSTLFNVFKSRFTLGKKMSTALILLSFLGMTSVAGFAHADRGEASTKKQVATEKQASSPVNINSASAALLAKALNGVGEAKAKAIVAHRNANGKFTSVDQLADVKGIGSSIVEKNRSLIRL